jgi:DNA-binding transcriptional LysR family regulator
MPRHCSTSFLVGIGCISRIALEDDFQCGNLKPYRVPHWDFRRQFFFLLHRRKYHSAGIKQWLEFCRNAA